MRKTLRAFIQQMKTFLARTYRQYDERLPYILTVVIALILVVSGINLFVELTDELQTEGLALYDSRITDYVISFRTPWLTDYFVLVTQLGDLYGYLAVVAIVMIVSYLVFQNWRYVAQITLVLLLSAVSNMMLKRFIDRARPGIEHLVSVETLSYPSGHAMSAMAFYGFSIYLFYTFKINKVLKFSVIALLVFLILSIGISRIYLGVHFPSDVAGGFIAGFIWVVFCALLFDALDLFRKEESKTPQQPV